MSMYNPVVFWIRRRFPASMPPQSSLERYRLAALLCLWGIYTYAAIGVVGAMGGLVGLITPRGAYLLSSIGLIGAFLCLIAELVFLALGQRRENEKH